MSRKSLHQQILISGYVIPKVSLTNTYQTCYNQSMLQDFEDSICKKNQYVYLNP